MKYSIFGFSQEYAAKLQKEQDGKVKKLDTTDLLILRDIADFMNRSRIIKYTIDDKVYFSIQYATILEDLPILDIKKQALSDRLDKMVFLNVLEKVVVKNQSGTFVAFRMGVEYEKLLYSCTSSETVPTSSELQVQTYSTTNHNTNTTNNSSTNKEERDLSLSKKGQKDELFEQCWKEYRRKGSKAKAKVQWDKLINDEKNKVITHIKAYVSSRDLQYQKDFERYLKDKIFNTLVIANNNILYDPTLFDTNEYRPTLTSQLLFHNEMKCYLYIGYFNGFIGDGYEDDNRPDGATIMLNNGRGTVIWNKEQKQWILQR